MKYSNKLLGVILAIVVIGTVCGVQKMPVKAEWWEGNFQYVIEDNKAAITGYNGEERELVIPSQIAGCPVTSIGDQAFYGNGYLNSLVLPDTLTSIGWQSFRDCDSLKSLTIPKSVTSIDSWAFYDCVALNEIHVDEENTKYDSRNNCNAICETSTDTLICASNSTVIPNTIKVIGRNAFYNYAGLKNITIPASVTSIDNQAFCGNNKVETVTVNPENKVFDSRNNCNAIIRTKDKVLIAGFNITQIPEGITRINGCAFANLSIRAIWIPDSVTSIGEYGFHNCYQLNDIVILANDCMIESDTFDSGCDTFYVIAGSETEKRLQEKGFHTSNKIPDRDELGNHEDEEPGDTPKDPGNTPQDSTGKNPIQGTESKPSSTLTTESNTTQGSTVTAVATPKVNKVKAVKVKRSKDRRKVTISWKKSGQVSGYEIKITTSSKSKKGKWISLSSKKKTYSKKKLNPKKKYYVSIRAYQIIKDSNNKTERIYSKEVKKRK